METQDIIRKITATDLIFATLTQRGVVTTLTLKGITSMQHLLQCVKNQLRTSAGIAQLNVRNSSQGWTASQSLFLL